jgi:hypothetical protein
MIVITHAEIAAAREGDQVEVRFTATTGCRSTVSLTHRAAVLLFAGLHQALHQQASGEAAARGSLPLCPLPVAQQESAHPLPL